MASEDVTNFFFLFREELQHIIASARDRQRFHYAINLGLVNAEPGGIDVTEVLELVGILREVLANQPQGEHVGGHGLVEVAAGAELLVCLDRTVGQHNPVAGGKRNMLDCYGKTGHMQDCVRPAEFDGCVVAIAAACADIPLGIAAVLNQLYRFDFERIYAYYRLYGGHDDRRRRAKPCRYGDIAVEHHIHTLKRRREGAVVSGVEMLKVQHGTADVIRPGD